MHTQQIGRIGGFDRVFCSPSNHRVHHAVTDKYIDKNYGGILILWDRLFGTFEEEDDRDPCVYGTRGPLRSWNPVWANLQVYWDLAKDSWRTERWADKLRVWLKPPGWRPADVAASYPKPAFDLAQVTRYDPPMSRGAQWAAAVLFVLLLAATSWFLWHAHTLSPGMLTGAALGIVAGLWAVGALSSGTRGRAASSPAAGAAGVPSGR